MVNLGERTEWTCSVCGDKVRRVKGRGWPTIRCCVLGCEGRYEHPIDVLAAGLSEREIEVEPHPRGGYKPVATYTHGHNLRIWMDPQDNVQIAQTIGDRDVVPGVFATPSCAAYQLGSLLGKW